MTRTRLHSSSSPFRDGSAAWRDRGAARCAARLALVACLFVAWPATRAAADEREGGVDVVLLVDVSGSMVTPGPVLDDDFERIAKEGRSGSDPQRFRWDAVKQLVDLLDPDDRVLILRFNEKCPARVDPAYESHYALADGSPYRPEDDFRTRLEFCYGPRRTELDRKIAQFNSPVGQGSPTWSLDRGGTGIVNALKVAGAALMEAARPGRNRCVILLTDGCDNGIDNYIAERDRESADWLTRPQDLLEAGKLRADLTGTLFLESGQPVCPVYAVGLNLSKIDNVAYSRDPAANNPTNISYSQSKARQFLAVIQDLTSGQFVPIDRAEELVKVYVKLIRDFKGLWFRQGGINQEGKSFRVNSGEPFAVTVEKGVIDFRTLAFVRDKLSDKLTTRPPLLEPPGQRWDGLEIGTRLALPELRQGTAGTLYDVWYGGADATNGPSPFAMLEKKPATWTATIAGNEKSSGDVTFFKKMFPETFGWPPAASTLYRHQVAVLSLQARRQAVVRATEIDWTLTPQLPSGAQQRPAITPDRFSVVDDRVELAIPAGELVFSPWKKTIEGQSGTWSLRGEGRTREPGGSRLLGGFQREFADRWNVNVRNELPIRLATVDIASPSRITISRKAPEYLFTVEAAFDRPLADIPVLLRFSPPRLDRKPLDPEWFRVARIDQTGRTPLPWKTENGSSFLSLRLDARGKARLALAWAPSLADQAIDLSSARLEQGRITVDSDDPTLASIRSNEIAIELALERVPLRFYRDVERKGEWKEPLELTPENEFQETPDLFLGRVLSETIANVADLSGQVALIPEKDDSAGHLTDEELVLLEIQADGTASPIPFRNGMWNVLLGKSGLVQLRLKYRVDPSRKTPPISGTKPPRVVLRATGVGVRDATAELFVKYRAPELLLTPERVSISAPPGSAFEFRLTADLKASIARPPVPLRLPELLEFQPDDRRAEPSGRRDTFAIPLTVEGQPQAVANAGPVEIRVRSSIPMSVTSGVYRGSLRFDAPDDVSVKPPLLPITLSVDRLKARIRRMGELDSEWKPVLPVDTAGPSARLPVRAFRGAGPVRFELEVRTELGLPVGPVVRVGNYSLRDDFGLWGADKVVVSEAAETTETIGRWIIVVPRLDTAGNDPYVMEIPLGGDSAGAGRLQIGVIFLEL